MNSLKLITVESAELEEDSIAINTDFPGNPILEYCKNKKWVPLDNLKTINRMARLDDLYTYLYLRDWCIGPRFSINDGDLYIHTDLHDSPIPTLSGGIKISDVTAPDELIEDMIKEIDIYYNSLVSTRNLIEGSSVVDLWKYPTEYGGILNLVTLPTTNSIPVLRLCIAWVIGGMRKTENMTFTPKDSDGNWIEFKRPLGDSEVTVEFHDGCIRVFPEKSEVTECIIHHCTATYDSLL